MRENNESPGVILLDYHMPPTNGVEVYKTLKPLIDETTTPVVFYSSYDDTEKINTAIRLGAAGYIIKGEDDEDEVLMREVSIIRNLVTQRWSENAVWRSINKLALTKLRETHLTQFRMICRGLTDAEIAINTGHQESTVSSYRAQILRELDNVSQLELYRIYVQAQRPLNVK